MSSQAVLVATLIYSWSILPWLLVTYLATNNTYILRTGAICSLVRGACILLLIHTNIFIDLCSWLGNLVYLWIGGRGPSGPKTTRSSEHSHTKACQLDPELTGRWLCVFGGNMVNEYW